MEWLFNPKNATIGSGIDQNKKSQSFCPIGKKMPFFIGKLSSAIENSDGNFWFWSTP